MQTQQVGGNMTNERAKKLKKHTKMHKSTAQFWSPVICTSWTLIKCYKSDIQIQHANDKLNVRFWFCRNCFSHCALKLNQTTVCRLALFSYSMYFHILKFLLPHRGLGQCAEKRRRWSTIVVSFNNLIGHFETSSFATFLCYWIEVFENVVFIYSGEDGDDDEEEVEVNVVVDVDDDSTESGSSVESDVE